MAFEELSEGQIRELCHERKTVFIYTGGVFVGDAFNTSNVGERKVWGSETSAVNLALMLAAGSKYRPILSCPVGEGFPPAFLDRGVINVDLRLTDYFLRTFRIDIYLVSRFLHFFLNHTVERGDVVLWCHDMAMNYKCITDGGVTYDLKDSGRPLWSMIKHRVKKVVAVSEWHGKKMSSVYGFYEGQLVACYNGVRKYDFDSVDPSTEMRMVDSFLYASDPVRGLTWALKVFRTVKEKKPEAQFFICWDKLPADLEAEVKKVGEEVGGIVFMGKLSNRDLRKLMRRTQYYLYPNIWHETFGIVALEALLSGCIPIVRNFSGIGEIVRISGGGVAVEGDVGGGALVGSGGMGGKAERERDILTNRVGADFLQRYVAAVLMIMDKPELQLALRRTGHAWAIKQGWEDRAEAWDKILG